MIAMVVSNKTWKGGFNVVRLAEVRKDHDLTQQRLSDLSGVSRVSIARIETGKMSPTLGVLEKLAGAMGVTVGELVDKKAG